ncbi:hypothetical protein Rhopal_005108-T1 [Rhodotorula paludigena]|uniref:Uncharacterized protein n=1 Tax=Rhodotorula paludigena TaxID=86838 RepID=A0AAV5GNN8_9BASI|nr:hypothetical protein Rhopal_005108-T1 [Rhodotorula paludigena]
MSRQGGKVLAANKFGRLVQELASPDRDKLYLSALKGNETQIRGGFKFRANAPTDCNPAATKPKSVKQSGMLYLSADAILSGRTPYPARSSVPSAVKWDAAWVEERRAEKASTVHCDGSALVGIRIDPDWEDGNFELWIRYESSSAQAGPPARRALDSWNFLYRASTDSKDKLAKLFSKQTLSNIREAARFIRAHVALLAAEAETEAAAQETTEATFKRKASLAENDGPVKKAKLLGSATAPGLDHAPSPLLDPLAAAPTAAAAAAMPLKPSDPDDDIIIVETAPAAAALPAAVQQPVIHFDKTVPYELYLNFSRSTSPLDLSDFPDFKRSKRAPPPLNPAAALPAAASPAGATALSPDPASSDDDITIVVDAPSPSKEAEVVSPRKALVSNLGLPPRKLLFSKELTEWSRKEAVTGPKKHFYWAKGQNHGKVKPQYAHLYKTDKNGFFIPK